MAAAKSLCIIGGGPAGVGLLWSLAQDQTIAAQWDVTLIHDEKHLGGHCATHKVTNPKTGKKVPVDIGVQCVSPLINPNVSLMCDEEPFATDAPVVDAAPLTLGCGFPDRDGKPMNWGNFPAYQSGDEFALWSEPGMEDDCRSLQDFIRNPIDDFRWLTRSLQDWFDDPPKPLANPNDFLTYFVDPYLSIMNGYGVPTMDSVLFYDLIPLFGKVPFFDGPMGSWTEPGKGWQRWQKGARSWVETMHGVAAGAFANLDLKLSTRATAVWLEDDGPVTVVWEGGPPDGVAFDKVVLTTDMHTNAALLDNAKNTTAWERWYADVLSETRWDKLQAGTCYIHADENIFSPHLRDQQELVQFTAYWSTKGAPDNMPYNPATTYATYLVGNVRQEAAADGLFVTMYGPEDTIVREPKDPIVTEKFTHGLWLPSAMKDSTKVVHRAQGVGGLNGTQPILPNTGTNLYFAGNNTTMDSVEGALVSAMVIANYAFGAPYPLLRMRPLSAAAFGMYLALYLELMFPISDETHRRALARHLEPRLLHAD